MARVRPLSPLVASRRPPNFQVVKKTPSNSKLVVDLRYIRKNDWLKFNEFVRHGDQIKQLFVRIILDGLTGLINYYLLSKVESKWDHDFYRIQMIIFFSVRICNMQGLCCMKPKCRLRHKCLFIFTSPFAFTRPLLSVLVGCYGHKDSERKLFESTGYLIKLN